jgi:hypothetical protein
MSDDKLHTASPGYALGRLQRALATASSHPDAAVRRRAAAKIDQWRAVLDNMASGRLTVGSRTPVADTPAWVTLEVAHGGFATGRYLAEGPLQAHEDELLARLPADVPGDSPRERLNHWYLGDDGQAALARAVAEGRLRVVVPEEGALPVVVWLLEHDHTSEALELLATLRPLIPRLRFYPELAAVPRPTGAVVRVATVGQVADGLRSTTPQRQVEAMNETLRVWNPLYDRLVDLWLATVEGESPHHQTDAAGQRVRRAGGQPIIEGGWPARVWPADWAARRERWLADYRAAAAQHQHCGKHRQPHSNFARLRTALERSARGPLAARDLGQVRQALAGAVQRRGAPGSAAHAALRAEQATAAARPSNVEFARLVAGRLDSLPKDGGVPALEPFVVEVRAGESPIVPAGTPIAPHLIAKVERALEAPIDELVERGVIGSSEVLAIVLPQITAQVAAAGIADPALRGLYEQIYAAFRRRRSLLLLNLEHQVRFDELPWVAALAPLRASNLGVKAQARQTLEQVAVLALSSFPETILPNPLVREMSALTGSAGLKIPLVEEVAADIFMGTFTAKWADAASGAASLLAGTFYARYYDLPAPAEAARLTQHKALRWGKSTADAFTELCKQRAREAGKDKGSWVAANGAIIEQSQILTTHNLAALLTGLDLDATLRRLAPGLAARTFAWIVRRQQQPAGHFKAGLQMVKNTAYAWRQAIFFLSLCDAGEQARVIDALAGLVAEQNATWAQRFAPAVAGLRLIAGGGRFDADGRADVGGRVARRFLGWSVGRHWLL